MAISQVVLQLLANKALRSVFTEIVKNRSVLLKELRVSVGEQLGAGNGTALAATDLVSTADIENAIRILKDAQLIKERSAPIEDFSTYFVTADGLNVERQLRLAETMFAS